jgi:hypothetical protein
VNNTEPQIEMVDRPEGTEFADGPDAGGRERPTIWEQVQAAIVEIARAEAAQLFFGTEVPRRCHELRCEIYDLIEDGEVGEDDVMQAIFAARRGSALRNVGIEEYSTAALLRPGQEAWVHCDEWMEESVCTGPGVFLRLLDLCDRAPDILGWEAVSPFDLVELYSGAWLSGEVPFGNFPTDEKTFGSLREIADVLWGADEARDSRIEPSTWGDRKDAPSAGVSRSGTCDPATSPSGPLCTGDDAMTLS